MTEPMTITIDGIAERITHRTTNRGHNMLDMTLHQVRHGKTGEAYHSYYPVTFWNERIPRDVKEGMRVHVEARVDGRRNQTTGRDYVGLTGVGCEITGTPVPAETETPGEAPETGNEAATDIGETMPF